MWANWSDDLEVATLSECTVRNRYSIIEGNRVHNITRILYRVCRARVNRGHV